MNRLQVVALSLFLCMVSLDAKAQNARPTIAPVYYTEYGVITFKFEGARIVGFYPHMNGKIIGKLKGNELKGTWRRRDGGGAIVITFSPDFSAFSVRYNHARAPDSWATDWSGVRKPEVQAREYTTLWGVMKCDFEGSQVACEYPWFNGKILGELKELALTGLWLQANGGGNVRMTFAEDFSSFTGTYNGFNFNQDNWIEWSGTIKK